MTNDIGTGTRNIAINVPVDEREFWGRLTAEMNVRSVGELHRQLLLKSLEQSHPEKAAELKAIRQRYYGSVLAVIICASMFFGGAGVAARRTVRPQTNVVRLIRNRSLAGRKHELELAA